VVAGRLEGGAAGPDTGAGMLQCAPAINRALRAWIDPEVHSLGKSDFFWMSLDRSRDAAALRLEDA
jgi:hypothetical protein